MIGFSPTGSTGKSIADDRDPCGARSSPSRGRGMNSLSFPFEELPDFRDGEYRSARITAALRFPIRGIGEWVVRTIALDCHNGKCGAAARAKMIEVSRAYQSALWEALCESLEALSRPHIQDAVDRALAQDGAPTAASRAENRFGARELV